MHMRPEHHYVLQLFSLSKVNPLAPSVEYTLHLTKIMIFKYEGIIAKISYERRVYESEDVWNPS